MGITVRSLSFAYEGRQILRDISLTVPPGQSAGVVGVSGGGKSTLLKLISGLYDVTDGEIAVFGETSSAGRRGNVAMVMQNATLLPVSIRDNITCGADISESEVLRACEAAQLTAWLETLPEGLDTFVGERGGKVSGGQGQRIAVARAIAKDAPVILLDEPTSALDNETGGALLNALASLTRGKTVLHVSHRVENLNGCDRIYRLEGGELRDTKFYQVN
jgi:ATP-binding cassette subfamily B protein/subfamily B ATP-binding cassette protein MsbA